MAKKTAAELAAKCKEIAQNYKTLYVLGCFGAPMNASNKERYTNNLSYNRGAARAAKIKAATASTFGFDCVCLIKGILWGWVGNTSHHYGGATYKSNGVPDIDESAMIQACSDVSTDFSNIQVGEVVWMPGHIGVYIGDGLAVEATPKWDDGVQITAVHNMGTKSGYNGRTWTKHGKLPYVTYEKATVETKVESKATVELAMLKKGAQGNQVKTLQTLLVALGYNVGYYGVDGDFGTNTDNAVRAFQKAKNLTPDGIVGKDTWSKLLKG